jgi:hypothetical protein
LQSGQRAIDLNGVEALETRNCSPFLNAKAGHSLPTFGQRKPRSFTTDYINLIGRKSMLYGVQTAITGIVQTAIIGTGN